LAQFSIMRFAGQRVWITGASSGIGEALAYAFAAEGARLVLSSRRVAVLEAVRRRCARSEEHVIVPLDVGVAGSIQHAVKTVLDLNGGLQILINNAGVSQRSLALDAAEAIERAILEVDYFGPVALAKAVLPSMLSRRMGHLVVISSVMGYVGTPGRSSYAAAKHALHGYFDSLRAEVWRSGVKVTLVCPGYVQTEVSANALGPKGERHAVTDATHQRGVPVERCAAAIVCAVVRGQEEVYVGGWEVAGIYLKRYVPWLYSRIVRRMRFSVQPAGR
jgi:dehydrogenase/reductase SDR family protein 7B